MSTPTATPKQVSFIRKLAEERPDVLGDLTVDEWLEVQQIAQLSIRDVSKVIDTLKSIPAMRKPEYAHLPEGHVIVNKRAGICPLCLHEVAIGEGYAVRTANGWSNYHKLGECVHLDVDLENIADGYYAFASITGNNDLDFFRVHVAKGQREILRVIGGHNDQRIPHAHLKDVVALFLSQSPEQLREAQALFGREIGRCGRCGRHLTDEASRAFGLGPECASK